MENNFIENFKSEELEERLEFGNWRIDPNVDRMVVETEAGTFEEAVLLGFIIFF